MRRLFAVALLGCQFFVFAWGQDFQIRVNVSVVSLEAVVLDNNSRAVTTLSKKDFSILDDGTPQEIHNFASVETPYNILLLFQNTSDIVDQRKFMVEAGNRFLDSLRAQDRVAVYTITNVLTKVMDWRKAQTGKRQEIAITPASGWLRLYEGLDLAYEYYGKPTGRKGMIVLTDGRDRVFLSAVAKAGQAPKEDDDKDFQRLLKKVRERRIPLYFVAMNTDRNLMDKGGDVLGTVPSAVLPKVPTPKPQSRSGSRPAVDQDLLRVEVRSRMEQLAEASGGRVYFPLKIEDVVPLYQQIGRELGTSYSLAYEPRNSTKDGKIHRIEVQVTNPDLHVVQSRQSYTSR